MCAHMKIIDCTTCTSREIEQNAKSMRQRKCKSQWPNFEINV